MATLFEREAELGALEALLGDAAAGRGGVAVVEGPAGIGKTALLSAAVRGTPRLGVRALVARAAELERDFPFGIVRQLLEAPVLGAPANARAALLDGPARRSGAVLDLDGAGTEETEPSAAVHGLFWLVANLAAEQPLLLAVDDVQWADEPSLRLLTYVARRLEALPIAVVATLRSGEPLAGTLDAVLGDPAVRRVRLQPLGPDGVAALVEARLGAPADPELVDACRERTGGNPFLLAELTAELAAAPGAITAGRLSELVPERVSAAIRRRLAGLGAKAQALARALVVLGDGAQPGLVGALADLDAHGTVRATTRLVGAELLESGAGLRFRHPLVRAAIAATVDPADLGRAHARAARLLAAQGADATRVAGHLLAAPPGDGDPWAVNALRDAARAARRHGAPEHAIAPLRRALAEPPAAELRPGVLRELGQAELAGMDHAAADHLRAARDLEADAGVRADLALELGTALYRTARHAAAVDVLLDAIEELDPHHEHRERRLRLEAFLAIAGRYDLATERAVRGRVHRVAAGLRGETPGERLVLAVAALEDPGPTAEGLARAAELQERVVGEVPWPDPSEGVGTVAMYLHAGRPARARALAEALLERARRADSPARHALALWARGAVHLDLGALDEAEADMRAALSSSTAEPAGVGQLVLVLAERGALEEAEALLAEHGLDGALPEHMILNPVLHARAFLRIAQRRWAEGAADARELGRRHEGWGMRRPSPNWRALAAEALRSQGDVDAARDLAEASLELARSWGTPKAIAIALRARALTAGDEQLRRDVDDAMAVLDGTPWRLDHARTGVELGAALRRAGRRREARDTLLAAMDEAARCGAAALAVRAADELRATGARPRRHAVTGRDALTASERRVAALAVEGRSNREIAQELFITVATVETHLRRTYRKLGIDGRAGLAGHDLDG
ncbi:MAG TPA: AAA family ATPase [Solirubrobacteraceae bacterium]|nr:AAA family ATPase [Solirubrobacteraceae bacterium]